MPVLLRVRTAEGVTPWISFDGERIVIGRSAGADLRLPDLTVALRHAVLSFEKRHYVLSDEGTRSGTHVGATRLSARAPHAVGTGDKLRFGRVLVDVSLEPLEAERSAKQASKRIAYQLVQHALKSLGEPCDARLVVVSGPDSGEELVLSVPDERYLIGRGEHCHLVLRDPNVSREHVDVRCVDDLVQVHDAGSRAGIKLGQESIAAGRKVTWKPSQHLAIGSTLIGLDDPIQRALDALDRGDEVALSKEEEALFLVEEAAPKLPADADAPNAADARADADAVASASHKGAARRKPAADSEEHDSAPLLARADVGLPTEKPQPNRQNEWTIAMFALIVFGISAFALYWLARNGK